MPFGGHNFLEPFDDNLHQKKKLGSRTYIKFQFGSR
jgi:hypothetical protein